MSNFVIGALIVAIVLAYMFIAGVVHGIMVIADEHHPWDKEEKVAIATLWPLALFLGAMYLLIRTSAKTIPHRVSAIFVSRYTKFKDRKINKEAEELAKATIHKG